MNKKRSVSEYLSTMIVWLAVAYAIITFFYFLSNPLAWLGRSWRFSVLFLPYAPLIHDVFFYSVFAIILFFSLRKYTWIALFITWSFAEASGDVLSYINGHWIYDASIDPTYDIKTLVFVLFFVFSLVIAKKLKFDPRLTYLNVGLLTGYFVFSLFFTTYLPYYSLTNGIQTVIYLGIFYNIMSNAWFGEIFADKETNTRKPETNETGLSGYDKKGEPFSLAGKNYGYTGQKR